MQRILSFIGPLLAVLLLAGAASAQEASPAPPPAAAPVAPTEPAAPTEPTAPAEAAPAPAAPFLPVPAPAAPAAASPAVITTIGRADMMAIMQQAGMASVSDGTRDETSPWVVGSAPGGIFVEIDFFNCEAGVTGPQRQCGQFRFRVHWANSKKLDAKAVDAYNERYVFGRALASSDGKFIETTEAFNLDGGVTRDYIAKNLGYFLITVDDFINYVKP
jgi:putative sensory transduction regulator